MIEDLPKGKAWCEFGIVSNANLCSGGLITEQRQNIDEQRRSQRRLATETVLNAVRCEAKLTDFLGLHEGASQEEINHRITTRQLNLPDETSADQLLDIFKRERLIAYFATIDLDMSAFTTGQIEHLAKLSGSEKSQWSFSAKSEQALAEVISNTGRDSLLS